MHGKIFSKEVKVSVVRGLQAGRPAEELCRQYSVSRPTAKRWLQEYAADPVNAFPGKGKITSLEARNAELERTVGRLYLQIELLKKALEALEAKLADQKAR